MIDLSGGQPDLAPEWVPWMMRALSDAGLSDSVYLWSDDNLSNDYFWRYLSSADRDLVSSYRMYGKVCCFKGFDPQSFAFNTQAAPEVFDRQFDLMARLVADTAIDLYGYATFTGPSADGLDDAMHLFVDRLQTIDENLPLRVVPLEIAAFTPVHSRGLDESRLRAMDIQQQAIAAFNIELERRFSEQARLREICDVPLHRH